MAIEDARYKALQQKLNEKWPNGPPPDVIKTYGDEMKASKKAVMDTMMECSSDAAFSKVMEDTKG